jgi:hypothetical protein
MLRVFGRLPGTDAMKYSEAGVKSLKGGNRVGGLCGGGVSLWGFDASV